MDWPWTSRPTRRNSAELFRKGQVWTKSLNESSNSANFTLQGSPTRTPISRGETTRNQNRILAKLLKMSKSKKEKLKIVRNLEKTMLAPILNRICEVWNAWTLTILTRFFQRETTIVWVRVAVLIRLRWRRFTRWEHSGRYLSNWIGQLGSASIARELKKN